MSQTRNLDTTLVAFLALAVLAFAAPSAEAAFPGQNGMIAFESDGSTGGNKEIFTMNPDGTLKLNRTNNAALDTDPGFAADGSKIAFVSNRDGNSEIYVMNADGTGQTRLTNNPAADANPAFSRNGKRIVFSSNREGGGNSELYAIDAAAGGNLTRLTTSTTVESEPAFSPDGSKIAFKWSGPGVGGLSVMNADGTGQTPLTSSVRGDSNPDFSPDGSKIAFDLSGSEIYTIKADGTGPRTNVSNNAAQDYQPAFSPDGTQIAFTRQATLSLGTATPIGIYTMNADGSGQTYRSLSPFQTGNPDSRASWGVTPASADKTPPETTITSGPTGTTNDDTPTFEFSSSEQGSSFECRVDSAAFASCSSPHTTAPLADGQHTFEVRATDVSGNTDASPASRAFTVSARTPGDTTPPQTTITSGPSGTTNDNTPTFEFGSDEAGSTFECRIDSQAFASCTSSHTTAQLSDGPHTFEVRATDPAGNADPTPAISAFTVDASPPQTTIISGPSGTTSDNTPTFEFSSDETGSSFECRLDTQAFASCASPHTTAPLPDGAHSFEVRATDAAGNLDQSPASRTFTVNTAASSPRRPEQPPPRQRQAPDTTRPVIRALSFSTGRFRAAGSGPSIAAATGTKLSYTLSEPARVSFRVERALAGRRAGGRCVSPRRSNRRARRCTRYKTLRGAFTHRGKAGANRLRFSGALRGRKLRPGRYRLRAIATDAAGNKSLPKRSRFGVMRR